MTSLPAYSGLLRKLDQHLAQRADHAHGSEHHTATTEAALTDLDRRLDAHPDTLTTTATRLRLPAPHLQPAGRVELDTVETGLTAARAAERAVTTQLDKALDLAARPPLLPHARSRTRAAAIYSTTAAASAIAAWILILTGVDTFTALAWGGAGLPTLALFTGYLTLAFASRPRLGGGSSERHQAMGAVLCFAALPMSYVLIILARAVVG
ncbi:hypothetical protein Lfu02_00660 [Longispora fulva]|uniref:Uncharacterized protein n=1 Tax=Longispora fulva TaxID=619741 RepID=A0A8J7GQ92_9ACTN|nr:hypothetical protein [Longispora fulva]MBG6136063.1 hypothetical protein [Longispora fulva]GIG55694.1 hypothetical protein Lfu02_00660 [Longispora fulva]